MTLDAKTLNDLKTLDAKMKIEVKGFGNSRTLCV